jgi:hypothetical protein
MSSAGERTIVVSEHLDETEDPVVYDPAARIRSITHFVREHTNQGKLRGVALARNVRCTISTDHGLFETDAVKIALDHEAGGGGGYTAYIAYRVDDGKAAVTEIVYDELPERFFTSGPESRRP